MINLRTGAAVKGRTSAAVNAKFKDKCCRAAVKYSKSAAVNDKKCKIFLSILSF
jgi:hypothetical protein